MAEFQPIIVFRGRHYVRHRRICNPICIKRLQIMFGVIPQQFKTKTTPLSQTVFLRSTNEAHTHTDRQTDRHTHTHDDSIKRNAMRCISPKNGSIYADIGRNTTIAQFSNFSESNCQ